MINVKWLFLNSFFFLFLTSWPCLYAISQKPMTPIIWVKLSDVFWFLKVKDNLIFYVKHIKTILVYQSRKINIMGSWPQGREKNVLRQNIRNTEWHERFIGSICPYILYLHMWRACKNIFPEKFVKRDFCIFFILSYTFQ